MNRVYAMLFGAMLAIASLVAVGAQQRPIHVAYGPPAPLCPPDGSSCDNGGPH